ncbi:hypothetical protein [Chryseobacterium sp. CT-SW4]|uniref:hypothetical protein n=1 Tax=Chryseobacterium sp. SW-1 TaxID=3157343 RepID=UPI003B015ABC
MVKKIKFANLIIITTIFISCTSSKTEYSISISSLKESDKPYPIVILTNKNIGTVKFPQQFYKINQRDLERIKKQCSINKKGKERLLVIEIKYNDKIEKYFFNRQESICNLNKIQTITSHYNNEDLKSSISFLEKVINVP